MTQEQRLRWASMQYLGTYLVLECSYIQVKHMLQTSIIYVTSYVNCYVKMACPDKPLTSTSGKRQKPANKEANGSRCNIYILYCIDVLMQILRIWYGIVNSPPILQAAAGLKGPKIQTATAFTRQPGFQKNAT